MKNYPGNKFSSFFNFNPKSLFLILSLLSVNSHSKDLDVVITVATYSGGTNLTCHGAHDGSMEAVIVGGTAPYSYQWNSGSYTAYSKSISNLGPGEYFFTVIDGNNDTIQKSGKIFNVDVLTANPELSHFEGGYNVSYQGRR
ncbi:MAG: SprB repeat-containing protein [Bacteroidetes bacterium]|nr:SprB repeat-containing protein [Bacteroidota bacterium]